MQKLLGGELLQAGLDEDSYRYCCSLTICWFATYRTEAIGDIQDETQKAFHYLKNHHMEFLYICFLLLLACG